MYSIVNVRSVRCTVDAGPQHVQHLTVVRCVTGWLVALATTAHVYLSTVLSEHGRRYHVPSLPLDLVFRVSPFSPCYVLCTKSTVRSTSTRGCLSSLIGPKQPDSQANPANVTRAWEGTCTVGLRRAYRRSTEIKLQGSLKIEVLFHWPVP